MKVLVFAEQRDGLLKKASLEAMTAGVKIAAATANFSSRHDSFTDEVANQKLCAINEVITKEVRSGVIHVIIILGILF